MKNTVKGLMFIGALTLSSIASATVIYNNGAPNQLSGNEMTEWIQAEDFSLAAASTLTDVHFWSVDSGLNDGTITWQIYSDNAGTPGSILASGNTALDTRTATGNVLSFGTEYENSFNIPALALGAGTYYLGLHNGPLSYTTRTEFYWETTGGNGTPSGVEDQTPFGTGGWSSNGQEHAFYLTGTTGTAVPEPASLALLGIGLAGLGVTRRRRKTA